MFGKKSWWPPDMLKGPRQFTEGIMNMQNSVRYAMYDVSRNAAIGGAAILALGVGAVVAAANWERSFADVKRTVQGTPAMLEQIRQGVIGLSQSIPVSFSELSKIASVGGQLGIASSGIVAYTSTIAKLTATTNLTADAAATALGRFKAFFAESSDPSLAVTDQTFSNLASSILRVGVNSVATESGIVNVATQISSMGAYAGFTADQVIGLAGALSSVGVPPELSRGVITRLFNTIGEAVSENGTKLKDFAGLAGVSSDEFRSAWGTEKFAHIFVDMVHGLGSVASSGGDAVAALHDLGINSVRDVPVLLRLATAAGEAGKAGTLLAQTMNDSRIGWRQNIEMTLQYNKIADTLVERTKVLMQNFEALFATMGQSATGPVKELVNGLITLVKGFTSLTATPAGQWAGTATIGISLLAGALLFATAGAARFLGGLQGAAVGLQAIGIEAAAATPIVRGLGIAMGTLGAIAAIAAVVGIFVAMNQGAAEATNAVTDATGAVAAMRQDAESGRQGFFHWAQAGGEAGKAMRDTASQADILAGITSNVTDQMYGAGDAATTFAADTGQAALTFGKASVSFVRSSLLASKAFTDLFAGEDGQSLGKGLLAGGFNMDELTKKVAAGGRKAGEAYLQGITGIKPNANVFEDVGNSWLWMDQAAAKTARSTGAMLDQVVGTVDGMKAAGSAALLAGSGFGQFTSAAQMSEDAMADFQVQNEEVIKSLAGGFGKFVDSGTMIGLAQQMREAYNTIDDGTTDVNEHADAVAGFEKAWTDAYGGAKFSIDDYMSVFRRAAGEQQTFIANLQELAARGVPQDIIGDLAAMGPQAQALVQALISSTDEQLSEYVALYQATGFDSMVGLAAGQLAAQQIVREAARHLSGVQLRELSASLAAGTPLVDAMAKWNLDAQGKPMTAPATVKPTDNFMSRFQQQANSGVSLPVTPYLTKTAITVTGGSAGGGSTSAYLKMYSGGYTGPGGMYDPAGIVHRGEYVHKKSDVDQSTGLPKPSVLMRMLSGRVAARHGGGSRGYDTGGHVTGGGTNAVIAHLSVEDRSLLMLIADRVGLYISQDTITNLVNNGNLNSSNRRQG